MNKADVAARAAKLSERRGGRTAQTKPPPTVPSSTKAIPRAKPVRVTTDLAPQAYRQLIAYCAELAETYGQAKVPHAAVVRALIAQLDTDPSLRATIAHTLVNKSANK